MSEMSTREIQSRIENIPPEKKRKKKIWNIIFLLFNVLVLALVFILNPPETDESILDVLRLANGWYLLLAIGTFAIVLLSEAFIFFYLIKLTTGRRRFKLAAKTALVGRYYDNVTPLATGGQPFQMYTLNKAGVPGATATSLPLVKYFTYMILYCILGLYVLIFRASVLDNLDSAAKVLVMSAAWIGLILNLVIPVFILLCSIIKPLGLALLNFSIRIGKALRIVKDPGKTYLKAQNLLTEYQKSLKCTANFPSLLVLTLLNIVTYIGTAVAPYFIILAFTRGEFVAADMLSTAFMTIITLISCSFFPAPGAAGAAELSFGVVFSMALVGGVLPFALLTWRFVSCYSFILIGIGIIIHDQFKARRKAKNLEAFAVTEEEPFEIPEIKIGEATKVEQFKADIPEIEINEEAEETVGQAERSQEDEPIQDEQPDEIRKDEPTPADDSESAEE